MLVWTLARKDLRLLLRDPRAMVVLLANTAPVTSSVTPKSSR